MSESEKKNTKVTTQTLWDAAAPMIAVTEKHPFLVSMVDGTLAEENFMYYVGQDALYLKDYADCLRRLGAKAPTPAERKRLEDFAHGAEVAEMELHNSFFKQWKIDAPSSESGDDDPGRLQMPNCLLYTSYLKRVVATESYACGLAVVLPCFWVYMHVGHVMLELRRSDAMKSSERKPQYDAWIDMYAGDDFVKDVKEYLALVDAELDRLQADPNDDNGAILTRMVGHFVTGCKLEHMFWDQAETLLEWPKIGGL